MLCYVVLAFVFVKLRKKYPLEKRGNVYHVKGGKPIIAYMVLCPIIVGIAGLYVNGTEYFLVGFVSIFSGIIAYVIFKWVYGGAAVTILGAVLLGIGKKKDPIVEILQKDLDTE